MRTRTIEINGRKAVIVSTDSKTWVTDPEDLGRFEARRQKEYAGARWYVNEYVGAHSHKNKATRSGWFQRKEAKNNGRHAD